MTMLQYDKGNPKIPRHKKPSIVDDEFETPPKVYEYLCKRFKVWPKIDVAATKENRKCEFYFTKEHNALERDWVIPITDEMIYNYDVWSNHPHTLHAEFVEKAHQQWTRFNITIMMILPANCMRTRYWHDYIEDVTEYHAIPGSIRFLKDGKPTKDTSRNAYVCVIWRKR